MSFPPYESYKETGVEWLGAVPEHWEVRKLSQLFRAEKGKSAQILTKEFCGANPGSYPVYSGQTENGGVMGSWDQFEFDAGHQGVLFSTTVGSDKVMAIRHLFGRFSLSQNCMIIRPSSRTCLTRFYYFHLQPLFNYERARIPQHMQASFRMDDLYSYRICVPPTEEQLVITRFLDQETAKIDALVEEQRRLIELLKEKRQAVISHAVTKGLNPDAPMKDSGIEWLGRIPTHWEVKRIKYVVRKLDQGWSPQCENYPAEEGQWAVLKVGCVNGGVFNADENKALPSELIPLPELGVCAGDVLVSRANTRELVGSAAAAVTDYPYHLICDKLYRLRVDKGVCRPGYLALFLGTPHAREEIELTATGASSSMLNIGQSTIKELPMALPNLHEQSEIEVFVHNATTKLGGLIEKANHAIELLQERRSALISAAVTGKIDVRGLLKEEAA